MDDKLTTLKHMLQYVDSQYIIDLGSQQGRKIILQTYLQRMTLDNHPKLELIEPILLHLYNLTNFIQFQPDTNFALLLVLP